MRFTSIVFRVDSIIIRAPKMNNKEIFRSEKVKKECACRLFFARETKRTLFSTRNILRLSSNRINMKNPQSYE